MHRLLLIVSRRDIRWLSGRGKTPTLCVFRAFSVAVMEECCNVCGDGYTFSGRVVWRERLQVSREHRLFSIGSRWDIRWLSGHGKTPTLCVFRVFIAAVIAEFVTLAVTGNNISCRFVCRRRMPVFERPRLLLTGSRWDIRGLSGCGKTLTLCVFPIFRVAVMERRCNACGDGINHFLSGCFAS
jgi:hypothetical protein